jgi:predicted kinase
MATLFLICGLPGGGKITLARQLERSQPALRLSPDEWIAPLLADPADTAELDRLRSPVEAVQVLQITMSRFYNTASNPCATLLFRPERFRSK